MTDAPYEKEIRYTFEAGGYDFAITRFSKDSIAIEELRKNGQEDGHLYCDFLLLDGKWTFLEDWAREEMGADWGSDLADELLNYFNEHGIPE